MKVILFDDQELFSKGVEEVLTQEVASFRTFPTSSNIIATVHRENPDVVLMDIHMEGKDGLEEGKKLVESNSESKVVFLTEYPFNQCYEEMISIGAAAVISKRSSREDFITKLRIVIKGNRIFPKKELMVESLTAKENKILQMITDGKTQKEVAIQLYMSQRTISTHMQHILNKLGVHSTVSAVVKALELGVVKIKSEKNQ